MFFFQYISARRFSLRSETLALARSVPAVAFFLFKKKLTSGAAAPDCRILFLPQIPPVWHDCARFGTVPKITLRLEE
jgi:hypothetical protein